MRVPGRAREWSGAVLGQPCANAAGHAYAVRKQHCLLHNADPWRTRFSDNSGYFNKRTSEGPWNSFSDRKGDRSRRTTTARAFQHGATIGKGQGGESLFRQGNPIRPRTHETGHTRLRSIPPVGVAAPVACCSQRTWLSAISERTSESLRNGSEHVLKCVEAARLQRRCNAFATRLQRVCSLATLMRHKVEGGGPKLHQLCRSASTVRNGFDMFRNRF